MYICIYMCVTDENSKWCHVGCARAVYVYILMCLVKILNGFSWLCKT